LSKNKFNWIVLLIASLCGQAVNADSLRCGANIVQVGDIKVDVLQKCGQPLATDSYCRNEYRTGRYGQEAICHNVDLWTFNFGQGTFLMNVEFEEGRITTITHGDRVN
jgi:hypothetical protein